MMNIDCEADSLVTGLAVSAKQQLTEKYVNHVAIRCDTVFQRGNLEVLGSSNIPPDGRSTARRFDCPRCF